MGTPSHQQLGLESVAVLKVSEKGQNKSFNMSVDADEVKRICDVYDWHGKGELDMYYFMDVFYALGMNLTKKTTVKYGQTDDVEKKFCKFDEVVSLVQQAVKEPEHTGNYHDYVELCKLYDKNENGTMMLAELETFLSLMGDEIPKEDCAKLLDELAVLRMRMVSSPTDPSWTNCAASKYQSTTKESPPKIRLVDFFIEDRNFKQLITCVITTFTELGVENPTLKSIEH